MKKEFKTTSDGSHTIYLPELDETYHSIHGAIQEAQHVFIKAGLKFVEGNELKILEIGFGTGLNALLTLLEVTNTEKKIEYTSLEAFPLSIEDVEQLNYVSELKLSDTERAYFNNLHNCAWEKLEAISPSFYLKKIEVKLWDYNSDEKFDLIYFDAFGPRVQPEMWGVDVFEKMFKCLNTNGVLVTYCAKGVVKRRLKEVGFKVESLPGPPGKREMTKAIKL